MFVEPFSRLEHLLVEIDPNFFTILLELLVDFFQFDRESVQTDQTLLVELDPVLYRRLVYDGERHVSDLLHCEHPRLFEPFHGHVVFVASMPAFKFAEIGHCKCVALVLVVLIPCAGVIKKEVLAVQQALLGLLELLLMLSLTGLVDDDDLFL